LSPFGFNGFTAFSCSYTGLAATGAGDREDDASEVVLLMSKLSFGEDWSFTYEDAPKKSRIPILLYLCRNDWSDEWGACSD
jgi:hypothetical protein